eukprot:g33075.t1
MVPNKMNKDTATQTRNPVKSHTDPLCAGLSKRVALLGTVTFVSISNTPSPRFARLHGHGTTGGDSLTAPVSSSKGKLLLDELNLRKYLGLYMKAVSARRVWFKLLGNTELQVLCIADLFSTKRCVAVRLDYSNCNTTRAPPMIQKINTRSTGRAALPLYGKLISCTWTLTKNASTFNMFFKVIKLVDYKRFIRYQMTILILMRYSNTKKVLFDNTMEQRRAGRAATMLN